MMKTSLLAVAGVLAIGAAAAPLLAEDAPPAGRMGHGIEAMFDRADVDKDGTVTEAEIAAAREDRFKTADSDGNGTISREEFDAMMDQRMSERRDRMFAHLDANSDGVLSEDERPEQRRGLMRADADGDKVVTRAELDAWVKDHPRHEGRRPKHGHGHDCGHEGPAPTPAP
ncbi:MAG: hypothetical protein GC199_01960 [Alphaproteobacteria bacterium]|nr:hypothetical protein [Alphaproteobacteria bacterium]